MSNRVNSQGSTSRQRAIDMKLYTQATLNGLIILYLCNNNKEKYVIGMAVSEGIMDG